MRTTVFVGVFAILLLCINAVLCGKLFVARADDGKALQLAEQLSADGFEIWGYYGDLVLTSIEDDIYNQTAQMVCIGVTGAEDYYVLERQERLGVSFDNALVISQEDATTLYSSFHRVIVSSKAHAIKQTLIDYDVEVIPVPKAPIHLGIRSELLSIVSDVYAQASRKYTAAPNPEIVSLVNAVTPGDLRAFVTYLTGEDPSSNILTRNSISPGAKDAAEWIQKQFQTFGLAATSSAFRTDYSPNVIGILPGVTDPTKIVVVGGHYDSRGPTSTSATQRAPGANDNGSGTGAVITMAKVIHELNATFDYTIHFLAYSGEEQGLYGSAAYATKLQTEKASVIGVLNADMVAYRVPTEKTQCAFPSRYSTPALETLAREAVATYVPELTIGITTACCSDHQSYYNRGFPATGFFERNGAIADPMYHKSEDLVERTGYDVDNQYTQLTRAILATLATVAGVTK